MVNRNKINPFKDFPNPQTLSEIEIPEDFKYIDGELFLQFDSGKDDPTRILIFYTSGNLKKLSENPNWYCDGTFEVAPTLFTQLYTIHAVKNGQNLPLVYGFLPKKTEAMYDVIFMHLKEKDLSPETITIDFEMAVINSITRYFPDALIHGCFFHFRQNLFRHIQECKLVKDYNNQEDSEVRVNLKKIAALAFLPISDVVKGYKLLTKKLPSVLDQFLEYFEPTYIGLETRRSRKEPLFRIDMWNVHSRSVAGMPRTNNNMEGWHNAFQQSIGSHPILVKLLDSIVKEHRLMESNYIPLFAGEKKKKSAKYARYDERIINLINDYNPKEILQFLEAMQFNISLD